MQTLRAFVPAVLLAVLAISCAGNSEVLDETGNTKTPPKTEGDTTTQPNEAPRRIGTNCKAENTKVLYTSAEGRSGWLPRITWSKDQYGVVWGQEAKEGNTIKYHAAFMRVSKDGAPQGDATFLTQSPTVYSVAAPQVVVAGMEKGFAVVWADTREGASKSDLYLKKLDENGQSQGGEKKITSSGSASSPYLVHPSFVDIEGTQPMDSLVMAWRDSRSRTAAPYPGGPVGGRSDIFYKVMNLDGSDKFPEKRVTTDSSKKDPGWPVMAYDGDHYALAWRDTLGGMSKSEIYFTYLNEDGSALVPETMVATQKGLFGSPPDLVWATNEFGISFSSNPSTDSGEVKFARIRRDNGEMVGSQTVFKEGLACTPSVSYNGERYAMVWQTKCGKPGSKLVFAILDDGGNPLKPDGTSCFGSGDPECGLVTVSPDDEGTHSFSNMISVDGKFAIVWMNAPKDRIYFSHITCTP